MKLFLIGLLLSSTTWAQFQVPNSTLSPKEKRAVVAIIDTGIDTSNDRFRRAMCDGGSYDFTGDGMNDVIGHGTHIATLILDGIDFSKVCVIYIKYVGGIITYSNMTAQAIVWATQQHAAVINFSSGGNGELLEETRAVKKALQSGIKVVVAAGNNGTALDYSCNYFPACAVKGEHFYVVGALNNAGIKASYSNYGAIVTDWLPGDLPGTTQNGTSFSTARKTRDLLLKLMKK